MEAAVWTLIGMQGATLFGLLYFVAGQLHGIRREMRELDAGLRGEMRELEAGLRAEIHDRTQRLETRIRESEARMMVRLDAHTERHAH